jgi:ribonuclease PH
MPDPTLRSDGRSAAQLRPIKFEAGIAPHATGSVLVSFGATRVICAAMIEPKVPAWMRQQGVKGGWLTAEYSMLPYSTLERKSRDISKGKLDGRTVEIQRLIGRSLRAVIDLQKLGDNTLWIDCDVLQADGGTRCASITGAFVALHDAVSVLIAKGLVKETPIIDFIAAISVGIGAECALLDLDYIEDSTGETDMNVVMTGAGKFVEIQGTAEGVPFSRRDMEGLVGMAERGIAELISAQRSALGY